MFRGLNLSVKTLPQQWIKKRKKKVVFFCYRDVNWGFLVTMKGYTEGDLKKLLVIHIPLFTDGTFTTTGLIYSFH